MKHRPRLSLHRPELAARRAAVGSRRPLFEGLESRLLLSRTWIDTPLDSSLTPALMVDATPTATALLLSEGVVEAGSPLHLRATVSAPVTGTVTFKEGDTVLATVPINGTTVVHTIPSLTKIWNAFTATFTPSDDGALASTSPVEYVTVVTSTKVDVLGIYTTQALSQMGGIEAIRSRLQQEVDATNVLLKGVGASPRLRLVGIVPTAAASSENASRRHMGADVMVLLDTTYATAVATVVGRQVLPANAPIPFEFFHAILFSPASSASDRPLAAQFQIMTTPFAAPGGIVGQPITLETQYEGAKFQIQQNGQQLATEHEPAPLFAIDSVTSRRIAGWVFDPRTLQSALSGRLVIDGVTLATFDANLERPDLLAAFGAAYHGFAVDIPVLAAGTHSLQLFATDTTGSEFLITQRDITVHSPLFDEDWYLARNPDVAAALASDQIDSAWAHFHLAGQFEGRNPSPYFDTAYYLEKNPDLAHARSSGQLPSPFAHYLSDGQYHWRRASPYFDELFYQLGNDDVRAALLSGQLKNGLEHFLLAGQYEGRSPIAYFDAAAYRAQLESVSTTLPPSLFDHFVMVGSTAGLSPTPLFDEAIYLANNPDVAAALAQGRFSSGFEHYARSGYKERRTFSASFSETGYLAKNPDVAREITFGTVSCGFEHYLRTGRLEGRQW